MCVPLGAQTLALYETEKSSEINPAVEKSLRGELAAILAESTLEIFDGFRIEWRNIDGSNRQSDKLAVVTFRGQCDTRDLNILPAYSGTLGHTDITDGHVLPYIDIDCDKLRAFLKRDLFLLEREESDALFGRALARILAHELYHAMNETTSHTRSGLAKALLNQDDLLRTHMFFSDRKKNRSTIMMRNSLR